MKPKNVANWLKTHLHRVLPHLDLDEIKRMHWELGRRREEMERIAKKVQHGTG